MVINDLSLTSTAAAIFSLLLYGLTPVSGHLLSLINEPIKGHLHDPRCTPTLMVVSWSRPVGGGLHLRGPAVFSSCSPIHIPLTSLSAHILTCDFLITKMILN